MKFPQPTQAKFRAVTTVIAAAFVIQSIGCGDNSAAIQAVQDAVQTSVNYSERASQRDPQATTDRDQRSFSPANPGRSNPFESRVNAEASTDSAGVKGISSASQIVVMGFAEVGAIRVMLRIGDQTKILKEGDKFSGVHVVSITPPQVQLKMDNLMWTATMFDERGK